MSKVYKGCIFDLDGTLANTLNSIAYYGNKTLSHFGLKEIPINDYKEFCGYNVNEFYRRMLSHINVNDQDMLERVKRLNNDLYDTDVLYQIEAYEGISALITTLKKRGIKLAVLSNKPHTTTQSIVHSLFGENTFDSCYGQREGVPGKPNPTPLVSIIDELSLKKEECIYVGDTSIDIETGKSAGVFTIGVSWGFRDRDHLEKHGADAIIFKPEEILQFILSSSL